MKLYLLIAALVACNHTCIAIDDNFEPGYIVKINGDTVRGYIEAMSNYSMSERINFKTSPYEKPGALSTKTISAFGFDTDNSHFQLVMFNGKAKDEDTVLKKFAKTIITGTTSLYLLETTDYAEGSQVELFLIAVFIVKKGDQYTTLRQLQSGQGFNAPPKKEYLGPLSTLFADCPGIKERDIKAVSFSIKSMTSIFRRYNNCKNSGTASVEYKTVSKWILGHDLSAAWLTTSSKSQDGPGSGFSGAYTMNFVKKGSTMQHAYSIGLMYRTSSFLYDYTSFVFTTHEKIQQAVISMPLTYKYYFNTVSKGPFLGAGFAFGYSYLTSGSNNAKQTIGNSFEIIPGINAGWNVTKKIGFTIFADETGFLTSTKDNRFFCRDRPYGKAQLKAFV